MSTSAASTPTDCPGGAINPGPPAGTPAPLLNDALLCGAPSSLDGVPANTVFSAIFAVDNNDEFEALHYLEALAVGNTVTDHDLVANPLSVTNADKAAAQTWGRSPAIAELWGLMLKAATDPTSSDPVEKNALQQAQAWLQSVFQRVAKIEAFDTGAEFQNWVGLLDHDRYLRDVNGSNWDDLMAYLQQSPKPGVGTTGYCKYQPPENPQDFGYEPPGGDRCGSDICPVYTQLCGPPPSLEKFAVWGAADSLQKMLDDRTIVSSMFAVAPEFGYGLAVSASPLASKLVGPAFTNRDAPGGIAAALAPITSAMSPQAAFAAEQTSLGLDQTAAWGTLIVDLAIAEETPLVDVLTLFIGILIDYEVAQAEGPSASAGAIVDNLKDPSVPSVSDLVKTQSGQAILFELFMAATLPQPQQIAQQRCVSGVICLNAPAIPAPNPATDTPFLISAADGSITSTEGGYTRPDRRQSSFTFYDAPTKSTATVSLHNGWFIEKVTLDCGSTCPTKKVCRELRVRPRVVREICNTVTQPVSYTVQTPRIIYTDWDGNEQTAWAVRSDAGGHEFVTFNYQGLWWSPAAATAGVTSEIYFQADAKGDRQEAILDYGDGTPAVQPCTGSASQCATSQTTTALKFAPATPTAGDYAALQVTVSHNCPKGTAGCAQPQGQVTIQRLDGLHDITVCQKTVNNGAIDCDWEDPPAGPLKLFATFLPSDPSTISGSQTSVWLPVSALPATTVTINQHAATAKLNEDVSITAVVTSTCRNCALDNDTPPGTLTFRWGGQTLCTAAVQVGKGGADSATCQTSFETAGKKGITVAFTSTKASPSGAQTVVTVLPTSGL